MSPAHRILAQLTRGHSPPFGGSSPHSSSSSLLEFVFLGQGGVNCLYFSCQANPEGDSGLVWCCVMGGIGRGAMKHPTGDFKGDTNYHSRRRGGGERASGPQGVKEERKRRERERERHDFSRSCHHLTCQEKESCCDGPLFR